MNLEQMHRGKSANDLVASSSPSPSSSTPRVGVGVGDAHVTRALDAMRADPSRRWTVAKLARVGGLSRAAFARRFKRATGVAPLHWLTEHRLHLAKTRLVETDLRLAGIATEIGYESEFAFAKAFKRWFGLAPGRYRRIAVASAMQLRAAA